MRSRTPEQAWMAINTVEDSPGQGLLRVVV
jgi:hypothetical protein